MRKNAEDCQHNDRLAKNTNKYSRNKKVNKLGAHHNSPAQTSCLITIRLPWHPKNYVFVNPSTLANFTYVKKDASK